MKNNNKVGFFVFELIFSLTILKILVFKKLMTPLMNKIKLSPVFGLVNRHGSFAL